MLYRLFVFVHVTAACLWIGGLLFFALVLVPVLRGSRDPRAAELVRAVGLRFRSVGWGALAILVVTGVGNLLFRVPLATLRELDFWRSDFGRLMALKLCLVALMLVISVAHDRLGVRASAAALREPRSRATMALRASASRLGRAVALLALAVAFVAVLLVRGVG